MKKLQKKTPARLVGRLLAVSLFVVLAACTTSAPATPTPTNPPAVPVRLSMDEAQAQVRIALYEWNPELTEEFEFELEELTTDEIWEQLDLQVFKMVEDELGNLPTFVLHKGTVDLIGDSFGGWGVTQVFATDLNADGTYELTYTYSWGSGIHRAHLAMYVLGETAPLDLEAEQIYIDGDYILVQVDAQTMLVYGVATLADPSNQALVGKLVLVDVAGELALQLERTDE